MNHYNFDKIDLHLHLDGSFRPSTLFEIAKSQNIPLPASNVEDYKALIKKQANAKSVNEYLKMFDAPLLCMQTKEALTRFTYELIEDLHNQHVSYAEIRFAPQLHTQKGLTQKDAIEAVLEGQEKALNTFKDIHTGIIACMMCIGEDTLNAKENMETVLVSKDYIGKGLVAIDLAGCEGFVPLTNFKPLFDQANAFHIPFTCHAGDSQDYKTIKDAIEMGAKRIGHGHKLYYNPEYVRYVAKNHIPLEVCPTSNVQCQTVPSYGMHPVENLLRMGVDVTINTDNMFLAGVSLEDEYDHCINDMGFTYKDLIQMNLNSINHAFCSEDIKAPIRKRLLEALANEN